MMQKFLEDLQSYGIYSFSRDQLKDNLRISEDALKKILQRYERKGKIQRIRRKFYIILTPEYKKTGSMPPILFIDDMMKYFKIDYYIALISAANIYGATHQQPQVLQVIVNKQLKSIINKRLRIIFITKNKFPKEKYFEKKKTDTGYIKVSSPELTCLDILKYQKQSGGINQVCEIISQLVELIDEKKILSLSKDMNKFIYLQRLGYVLDFLKYDKIADRIYKDLKKHKPHPIKLIAGNNEIITYNEKWKVFVNYDIEKDLL